MTTTSYCVSTVVTLPPRSSVDARRLGPAARRGRPGGEISVEPDGVASLPARPARFRAVAAYCFNPSTARRTRFETRSTRTRARRRHGGRAPHRVEGVGRRGERRVLVVGQLEVGRRRVGLGLLDRRGAGDHHHVGSPEEPGQGHLRAGGPVRVGHLAQTSRTGASRRTFSGRNAGVPEPIARGQVVGVVAAREQALAERAVGDDQAVVGLGPGQQLGSRGRGR